MEMLAISPARFRPSFILSFLLSQFIAFVVIVSVLQPWRPCPASTLNKSWPSASLRRTSRTQQGRDVALYALGVGAAAADACNPTQLAFVYHPDGQSAIKVLPTFAVLFPSKFVELLQRIPGLHHDTNLLLHGEQYLEIYKPLPTNANIESTIRISGLHDKGKAAIIELETLSRNKDTGDVLCMNRNTIFLRGAGGFTTSGRQMPYSFFDRTPPKVGTPKRLHGGTPTKGSSSEVVDKEPDFVFEDRIQESQALLYRLSGDYNPLHVDPEFARKAGFPRPILHGLCTLGYATRAVVTCTCGGDPTRVQSVQGRFMLHVFPGETVVAEMWMDKVHNRVDYKLKVKERNKVVLAGSVTLFPTISRL